MQFPYFFTMRNGGDKVRVEHLFNDTFEFYIQYENGVADKFVYSRASEQWEKDEIVKGDLSRKIAVDQFEQAWEDSKQ